MMKIVAICGSTKQPSTNSRILEIIQGLCAGRADFQVYDITQLPYFNPDIDNEQPPDTVSEYRHTLRDADAVIICTPEYVFSLPGVLKNALEWTVSSSSFSGKPVGLIVASSLGEKAYESLLLIMKTIEAIYDDTTLLVSGAKAKVSNDNAELEEKLAGLLQALIAKMNY